MTRPNSMRPRWKKLAMTLALFGAAVSLKFAAQPEVRRPVAHFVQIYRQSPELGVWERLMYSLLLTKSTEPSS